MRTAAVSSERADKRPLSMGFGKGPTRASGERYLSRRESATRASGGHDFSRAVRRNHTIRLLPLRFAS